MPTSEQRLPRTRNGTPRLRRTDDVIDYWIERIDLVAPAHENFSYASMICEGDSLFHYGRHFELARIIRDQRGRTRLVLLNGDTYGGAGGFGPSTSARQSQTRRAVAIANAPHMIAPFSALAGAGIDFDTIMPIHVRADRHTTEQHSSREQPTKGLASMRDPSGAMRTETYYGRDPETDEWRNDLEREVPVIVPNPNQTAPFRAQHGWCDAGAHRGEDGIWRWEVQRHWLGDSIFRARSTERRTRKATPEELAESRRATQWEGEANRLRGHIEQIGVALRPWARPSGTGHYRRTVRLEMALEGYHRALERHRESPVHPNGVRNGRVPIQVTRWATYLSSFDYQEPRALYFLCELPYRAKPNTVEQAVEMLKPPEVVAALARGLKVVRQGDLFAIPTKLTKRQIRRMRGRQDFTNRLRVLGTNHSVGEGIVCKGGAVLGRGTMRHEPDGWRGPDHRPQKLGDGKTWHILVRNTVPRTHN